MRSGLGIAVVVAAVVGGSLAQARDRWAHHPVSTFGAEGQPSGAITPPKTGPHVGHRGGTIAFDAHGLLVAERTAGALVRVDDQGKPLAQLNLHAGLGELVTAGSDVAFVADRAGNRIVRVDTSRSDALLVSREVPVPEPFGLSLSPEGTMLYATSVADHSLVALDVDTLKIAWTVELAAEPRAVAISPDGAYAVVGFLSSGSLAQVELASRGDRVRWHSLDPRDHANLDLEVDPYIKRRHLPPAFIEARSRFAVPTDRGRRRARGVFALSYMGHETIAAPHQLATPQLARVPRRDARDVYGGGGDVSPMTARLALARSTTIGQVHARGHDITPSQPRALDYVPQDDLLFIAGYGNDTVIEMAEASQAAPFTRSTFKLPRACAPDGLVVRGDRVWVHCELSRSVVAFDRGAAGVFVEVLRGPALAASQRPPEVERGANLFRRVDERLSAGSGLACSSCHPEGRQDGLSWRLGETIVQTPMLAGRVKETSPYKWTGSDMSLRESFAHTIKRLGGRPRSFSAREYADLAAYVQWLPTPDPRSVHDESAVKRGRGLFEGDLGCDGCHTGATLSDGAQHMFGSRGLSQADTPSLVGLGHTAPYYHDGSAVTLRALITDKGSVHNMADFSTLDDAQAADLLAYLESL